jgi:hypothetical protein
MNEMNAWDAFLKWFATSQVASVFRVMLAFVVNAMITKFVEVGAFDFTDWKVWVIGALSACLPMLLRLINPADPLGNPVK